MSLRITNTRIFYPENQKPILEIDSLEFDVGINFLIGRNGSGKSTLLKAISNYNDEVIVTGKFEIEGKPLINVNVGTVSQNPQKSINLELTFLENLLLAKTNNSEHLSLSKQVNIESINYILKFLERFHNNEFLKNLLDKIAYNLSSGQQQILSILMRVIHFQKVLLLDECTSNLDKENTKIIIGILLELVKEGTIVIFATHEIELLTTPNSKNFILENGTIKKQINKI